MMRTTEEKPATGTAAELTGGTARGPQALGHDSLGPSRLSTVFQLRSSAGLFGADRVVLDLCLELPAAGYRPVLVPIIEPGGVGEKLRSAAEAAGVLVRPLILSHRFDRQAVARLRRLAAIEGPQILHGHDYKSNLLIQLAGIDDTRRVATLHGRVGTDWKLRLYEAIDARLVRSFDRVICVSERMRAREERPGFQPIAIPNGIDLTRFVRAATDPELRARARSALRLPEEAEVVGSVGRLSAEKGYDVLVRAAARLVPSHPRLHLVLVGDGHERGALGQLAAQLGVGDRLHLPGLREDSPALYPAFDVFCLPSYREGLPLALLEALAAGLPAVVTAVGGVAEVIGEAEPVAITVAPGDVEGLAAGLAPLLNDSALRARLGALARRRVEERFSRREMAKAVARLYDALLSRSGNGVSAANQTRALE
jgi:glycosyltransferase involved in cell wall biosynthesis